MNDRFTVPFFYCARLAVFLEEKRVLASGKHGKTLSSYKGKKSCTFFFFLHFCSSRL